jgi:hypothetical protein
MHADEAARATERTETLYVLRAAPASRSSSCGSVVDSLTAAVAGLGLQGSFRSGSDSSSGQEEAHFQMRANEARLLRKVAAAMADASDFTPAFEQVKLRYNLGEAAGACGFAAG